MRGHWSYAENDFHTLTAEFLVDILGESQREVKRERKHMWTCVTIENLMTTFISLKKREKEENMQATAIMANILN